MVSFQCNSTTGADLCLNNGNCTVLTWFDKDENGAIVELTRNELGCTCPNGFEFDFVYYHFPSCGLPSNAYLGILIYYSIASSVLIILIAKESWSISHVKTRQVAIANALVLLSTWGQIASVYFQHGAFEANAVFAIISIVLSLYMGGKLSVSFMEILAAVRRTPVGRFRKVLRICTAAAIVTTIPCGLAMLALSRRSNAAYNLAAWFMETQLIIWMTVFCSAIAYYTTVLLGNIESASTLKGSANDPTRKAIRELIRKVRFIRNSSLYNACVIFGFGAPKAVAFLVLGSVPYQWVFGYCLIYQGLLVMSCGVLMFVRHTNRKRRRDEERRKKEVEMGQRSSAPGDDSQNVAGTDSPRKRRKELGMQTNGKYGRTWLFRGSSLMTNQNKDRTKMTYDPQAQSPIQPQPDVIRNSPAITDITTVTSSPKTGFRLFSG